MKKKIPKFKSEKEERKFWQTHDSTKYLDWSQAISLLHLLEARRSKSKVLLLIAKYRYLEIPDRWRK